MRKLTSIIAVALLAVFLIAGDSTAGYLTDYENITEYDGTTGTTGSDEWYNDGNGAWNVLNEDDEVEPNASTGQEWDLEGFFQKGNSLAMVGGFDFENGERWSGTPSPVTSGDIFIDTTGDARESTHATNGYEYVLDLDFVSKTYKVIGLYDFNDPQGYTADLENVFVADYEESNPLRYTSGGLLLLENEVFTYTTGLSDEEVGLSGGEESGAHNGLKVDLSFLGSDTPFTAHFTMSCGNDNLMGSGTTAAPVPEPATMILFGSGLIGLAGIGRKNVKRNKVRQKHLV